MVALPFTVILAELVLFSSQISSAIDIINQFQPLVDGDNNTLVSENGTFELGFFTPGSSTNRYVGIWYKIIPKRTVVWVANRDNPIKDNASNMLIINKDNGNLVLLSNNHTLWSTNLTTNHVTPIVKLLDNGNLVLRNENDTVTEIFLWQSFDYPTDTLLPGMKLGRNLRTGFNRIITAWKNWDDPSSGNFNLGIVLDSTASIPAMVMWNGLAIYWSGGPWIGSRFGGGPDIDIPIYSRRFVHNEDEVFYSYEVMDRSIIVRIVLNQTINSRKLTTWDIRNGYFITKALVPKDHCDRYNLCGPYGNCVLGNSPMCQCLKGFEPKSFQDWDALNFTQGCARSKPWSCKDKDKDGFQVFAMMKFPYTTHSWVDRNMTLKDCKTKCLENCSCTAYSSLDERDDSGCSIWFGDLIDLRLAYKTGPYLYVRMAVSDKGEVAVDHCDRYNLCGAHGNCVFGQSPICQCLHGFEPKSSKDWDAMNWTQGCVRSKPWSCKVKDKDGFREFAMMKFPDTTHSWFDRNMTLEDCKAKCFENCSCTAYSSLDVKDGSGCSIWFGELIDLRLASENGLVLYVRMVVSDKGKVPKDHCDPYNLCGPHGNCVLGQSPICKCLRGFEPKSSLDWDAMNWTHGCVRSEPWSCKVKDNDGFHVFAMMKFPDTTYSWVDRNMTLDDCKAKCFENCSCTAYSSLDVTDGSGCSIWFGDLIDLRLALENGQDLYVRMAISYKAANEKKARNGCKKKVALVITITLPLALLLLFGFSYIYRSKTKCREKILSKETKDEADQEDLELPFYDLATIAKATNNFSIDNKLGEGGFGPVYKGTLEDGKDVAVKRLSRNSRQGLQEFKNEVMLCAKLQHRNLVKVLGCCTDGEETMLLYEYMPNKSLDTFLFDSTQCKLLDWSKRFHILCAIARGMLYLHQDSRLRIIHRDLKASNILLDNDMNPKISDFGLAKMCGDDQTEGSTSRLVGTFGYMAPEYINEGLFSIKSDVFSFGVLLLEIVSGKKNRHPNQNCNLVEHAWRLWNECIPKEFIDECLQNSCILSEALRCIHVGLLCVQHHPDDRPTMSSVLAMLSSESILPQPREPGFLIEKVSPEGCSSEKQTSSINNVSQYYTHDNCFTS